MQYGLERQAGKKYRRMSEASYVNEWESRRACEGDGCNQVQDGKKAGLGCVVYIKRVRAAKK